jgi:hypothetical protein
MSEPEGLEESRSSSDENSSCEDDICDIDDASKIENSQPEEKVPTYYFVIFE